MAPVVFKLAYKALPAHALGLLENPSREEQQRLTADVQALWADRTIDQAVKSQLLGVAVMRVTGPDLLKDAVEALGDAITAAPQPPPGQTSPPQTAEEATTG
jgi:hypothetical protein